ncbi:hypothetical protein B0A50_00275 [Salinomyces thailandicus]|uniref:NAD(P)-binding protein n=1 Tax=Salinomyces thailandicus TaxID=706561 RepID=A0A4U0UI66_9PEZI|nr:hypothetical protein B0A50_00275 [Salinomyces thailandica]
MPHPTPDSGPPWHHAITLDLILHLLSQTLFHPLPVTLIPLYNLALGHPPNSPRVIYPLLYALLLGALRLLNHLNHRLAYGPPRTLNWDEEVIVITGGASGLGRIIAEIYGMRGASVAVLDIRQPSEEEVRESEGLAGVKFYLCDVGDAEAVAKAKVQVENDLGRVSILINNAAAPVNGLPLLHLPPHLYQKTINANLLSHFHTLHTFLPSLLSSNPKDPSPAQTHPTTTETPIPTHTGGTIVTITSVLAHLGTATLADYTASKAGLLALHASLNAELQQNPPPKPTATSPQTPNLVKTILVTPGQLSTPLFAGVQTPSNFLGPVVEVRELAKRIVAKVDSGMSGEVRAPGYCWGIEWMGVLPVGLRKVVRGLAGVDGAMAGFAGGRRGDGGGRAGKEE